MSKIPCAKCARWLRLTSLKKHLRTIHHLPDDEVEQIYEDAEKILDDDEPEVQETPASTASALEKEESTVVSEDTVAADDTVPARDTVEIETTAETKDTVASKGTVEAKSVRAVKDDFILAATHIKSALWIALDESEEKPRVKKAANKDKQRIEPQESEEPPAKKSASDDEQRIVPQNSSVPLGSFHSMPNRRPASSTAVVSLPAKRPKQLDKSSEGSATLSNPTMIPIHQMMVAESMWPLNVSHKCFIGPGLSTFMIRQLGNYPARPFPDQLVRIVQDLLLCTYRPRDIFDQIPVAVQGAASLSISLCENDRMMIKQIEVPSSITGARRWLEALLRAIGCCPGLFVEPEAVCRSCAEQENGIVEKQIAAMWNARLIAYRFEKLAGRSVANAVITMNIDYKKLKMMGVDDVKAIFRVEGTKLKMLMEAARDIDSEVERFMKNRF